MSNEYYNIPVRTFRVNTVKYSKNEIIRPILTNIEIDTYTNITFTDIATMLPYYIPSKFVHKYLFAVRRNCKIKIVSVDKFH